MADTIRFIAQNPILGKFPQVDGGGKITFQFSNPEYLKLIRLGLDEYQKCNLNITIEKEGK